MSATSQPSPGPDTEIVRVETPRGESTLARVVDRELSADINATMTVTVEALGMRWRVDGDDVTPV